MPDPIDSNSKIKLMSIRSSDKGKNGRRSFSKYRPLPLDFYRQDTLTLVPNVLGKVLVRRIGKDVMAGRIVEVEAYVGSDPASHAANGMTERNKVMFEAGGVAYVYFTYGMHFCFNIVTEREGFPAALLVRALEPLEGIGEMKRRRGTDVLRNLTNGPAKLCQAMGIDRKLNGISLDSRELSIEDDGFVLGECDIESSTRIGIRVATDRRWRFFIKNNAFVSRIPATRGAHR
ncbi:MAG: DNA-3-methyladenine glycosylase [Bacteroidetes bacterium]|nr:DNA-3-methyladenine glycosylase [Bacteroidota bacterium]